MAGSSRTVQINVIGNTTQVTSSLDGLATKTASTGSSMSESFNKVLGTLNQSDVLGPFGNVLSQIGNSFDALTQKAKSVGDQMMAWGGIAATIGGALMAGSASDVQAQSQLQQAITDTGDIAGDYSSQIEENIKQNEQFAFSASDTQNALTTLTTATGDTNSALSQMELTANLAASQHESLADAAQQVAKVDMGTAAKTLVQYGISSKDATAAAQVQLGLTGQLTQAQKDQVTALAGQMEANELAGKVYGQASAAVAGATGQIRVWKTEAEDAFASVGAAVGPPLTALGSLGALVGGGVQLWSKFGGAAQGAAGAAEAVGAAGAVAAGGEDAMAAGAVAADAATLPLIATVGLFVLAGVALFALGFELEQHWTQVWTAIKTATTDAISAIGTAFDWLGNKATALWDGFRSGVDTVANIFLDIGKAMYNGMFWPLNQAIGLLDDLHVGFTVPNWVPLVGGDSFNLGFDIPQLPMLAAGGIVTGPTVAMIGEAGPEAVIPLSGSGAFQMNQITVQIDSQTIAQATAPAVRNQLIRMGRGLNNLAMS